MAQSDLRGPRRAVLPLDPAAVRLPPCRGLRRRGEEAGESLHLARVGVDFLQAIDAVPVVYDQELAGPRTVRLDRHENRVAEVAEGPGHGHALVGARRRIV